LPPRILWEDRPGVRHASLWTALLPLLTGRTYIGGLDPEAQIEHAYPGFVDGVLAGRPVASWSDAELEDYCRRYAVGWVMCWSAPAEARLRRWRQAEWVATVPGLDGGHLFRLPPRPFALKGQATLLRADAQCIALGDVVPKDGEVILSLHYQADLRASPSRVRVEREPDPYDPIPFLRLRLPGPVARITLTWEKE
jgi:hypothetical protein